MSIIAINCLGYSYDVQGGKAQTIVGGSLKGAASSFRGGTQSLLSVVNAGRFEEEMLYDISTVEKLRELDEAKRNAIEQLDFERAIKIKEAIERLREVG